MYSCVILTGVHTPTLTPTPTHPLDSRISGGATMVIIILIIIITTVIAIAVLLRSNCFLWYGRLSAFWSQIVSGDRFIARYYYTRHTYKLGKYYL